MMYLILIPRVMVFIGYCGYCGMAKSMNLKPILNVLMLSLYRVIVIVAGYVVGNLCAYIVLQRIDAAAYTVISQVKLFTTAMFSWCFLGTYVSGTKYRALIILAMGCILVTSPGFNKYPDCDLINVPTTKQEKVTLSILLRCIGYVWL